LSTIGALVILVYLLLPARAFCPKIEYPDSEDLIVIQDNTIKAVSAPVFIKPITYGALIDCLQKHESGFNEMAIGDRGTSFGCLQFKKSTFKEFCIDKYKIAYSLDEIWDCQKQIECANEMLCERWEHITKWSASRKCLK
jgi:hypothetical protein